MAALTVLFKHSRPGTAGHFGKVDKSLLDGTEKAGLLRTQGPKAPSSSSAQNLLRWRNLARHRDHQEVISHHLSGAEKSHSNKPRPSCPRETIDFAEETEIDADKVFSARDMRIDPAAREGNLVTVVLMPLTQSGVK